MFGVLAIDKPQGCTSRDVVNQVQRMLRPDKVGHTGTLDPMATGVLLLAIGQATRLMEFSHGLAKSYEADFRLGCSSETLDLDSHVEPLVNAVEISEAEYLLEASRWVGEIEQVPPRYSAVHVGGRRAHELARRGESFQLPPRQVVVHELELLRYHYPCVTLAIRCSSGTYIRSLGSDIALSLGTNAVMTRLVRTAVGSVSLNDCVRLEELGGKHDIEHLLKPASLLTQSLPSCVLSETGCRKIRNGIAVQPADFLQAPTTSHAAPDGPALQRTAWAAFDPSAGMVAILQYAEGNYRSLRVFHNTKETTQPNKISTPHNPES